MHIGVGYDCGMLLAVESDGSHCKVSECASEIAERWNSMSEDKQKAATDGTLKELGDSHENRQLSIHNSSLSTFHDFRTSMDAVKLERPSSLLCDQTLATSTGLNVFSTSDRLIEFINTAFKQPISDVAARMEGFMISGVEGLVRNHQQRLLKKKADLSALVLKKLQECAGRTKISRMYYVNFADHITRIHGIVVKNWLLKKFVNPSSLNNNIELDLLLNAWNSGTTYFHKLTTSEYNAWEEVGFDEVFAVTTMQTQTTGVGDSDDLPADGATDVTSSTSTDDPPSPSTNASDSSTPSNSDTSTGSSAQPLPPAAPVPVPMTTSFINNTVGGVNGQTVMVTQTKRKQRSDAGKPRKKKRAVANQNDCPQAVPST
ncbi:hypothetical protein K435DRAFT_870723 [Dendrothele bispora CBS 962.96]|uniref:Uncharacterized protein n=1 Tax=Dendrothele bispora (strain CBS 962.96) TaxID=1314807 RepID=A0A4S8L5X9_DENBC|nr:hypothetical protein K435DRAFT_879027 [Dendrothele bispora CBS 962.96]THU84017.1 hypothetical protein K435DRAFT_870723 [Dendrothele bispora CBS 962.96]